MKKILGAISCALILVSLFIPFISYDEFNQSLYESYKLIDSLYIIYILIAVLIIGILVFAVGKKTSYAYFVSGMVMFFILREVIEIINNNGFNMLSVGFYSMGIGEITLLIMTLLTDD